MPRTTEAAVRLVADLDADLDITPFIEVANDLVTDVCTDSDYTDAKLELIERWLSAHFAHVKEMRSANEKAGSVGQAFQYKVDLNLAVTIYGQQAMVIDTAGNLAALNVRITEGRGGVGMSWLGKKEVERAAEDDDDE